MKKVKETAIWMIKVFAIAVCVSVGVTAGIVSDLITLDAGVGAVITGSLLYLYVRKKKKWLRSQILRFSSR